MVGGSFQRFLNGLGFEQNPFAKSNAAQEERLDEYFIKPRYFHSLVGEPGQPQSALVFAPRGSGKTAQKIMLERHCPQSGILPISYDCFPIPTSPSADSFTLEYHLGNVLRQGMLALASYMIEHAIPITTLSEASQRHFTGLAAHYIGTSSREEFEAFTRSLRGRIEQFVEVYNQWRQAGNVLLSPLWKLLRIDGLPALPQRGPIDAGASPRDHFERFKLLCRELRFQSAYVLVDRVDETEWTGNDPERSYFLIRSLLRSLPLLDDPFVAWKFFLWDRVFEHCQHDARPDRVQQFRLAWKNDELEVVLSRRLSAFSGGRITDFNQIFQNPKNGGLTPLHLCLLFAHRSPRNLIRLINDVLSEQVELNPEATQIVDDALEQGITKFCESSVRETYPEEHVRQIRRIGKVSFTIADLASNVFHEKANATRSRVSKWEASGIVCQNGTIKHEQGTKPAHYYTIRDPRVARVVLQNRTVKDVLRSKSCRCKECGEPLFSEFEAREDALLCPYCDRQAQ